MNSLPFGILHPILEPCRKGLANGFGVFRHASVQMPGHITVILHTSCSLWSSPRLYLIPLFPSLSLIRGLRWPISLWIWGERLSLALSFHFWTSDPPYKAENRQQRGGLKWSADWAAWTAYSMALRSPSNKASSSCIQLPLTLFPHLLQAV